VPAMPACLLEPVWGEFAALLGDQCPEFDPAHLLGCHRRSVPDRVVFEHVIAALGHGSGYERIASAAARTAPSAAGSKRGGGGDRRAGARAGTGRL
jgi:hypothetical protein